MPFQPVPNTVKVTVTGSLAGQAIVNVYHVTKASAPTLSDLATIRDLFITWLRDDVLPLLAEEFVYTLIELLDLTVENGIFNSQSIEAPNTGAVSGGVMPNETAFCVSLHTAQSGRSFRGRKFMSGIPRGQVEGNNVSGAYADFWVGAFSNLLSDLEGFNLQLSVVSYVQNGVRLSSGIPTQVTSPVYTDTVLDSQRPRKPGHGA